MVDQLPLTKSERSTRRCFAPAIGPISRGQSTDMTDTLTDQLRGCCSQRQVDGARIAMAENAGGYMGPDEAVATVTILGAVSR